MLYEVITEGYPSTHFVQLVSKNRPEQVTLVPDGPDAITSHEGWDTKRHLDFLKDIVDEFKAQGIRTSIFVDANLEMIEFAAKTGTDRIELYTEPYATNYLVNKEFAIRPFIEAAQLAKKLGLGVNAGHDLSLVNLGYLKKCIPFMKEVSIGHALISRITSYNVCYTKLLRFLIAIFSKSAICIF